MKSPSKVWEYGDVVTGGDGGVTMHIRLMFLANDSRDDMYFWGIVIWSDVPEATVGEKWNDKFHRWVFVDD